MFLWRNQRSKAISQRHQDCISNRLKLLADVVVIVNGRGVHFQWLWPISSYDVLIQPPFWAMHAVVKFVRNARCSHLRGHVLHVFIQVLPLLQANVVADGLVTNNAFLAE